MGQSAGNTEPGGRKLILVDHVAVPEYIRRAPIRPVEILDGSKDKNALEGVGFAQSARVMDDIFGLLVGAAHAQKAWTDTVTITLQPNGATGIKHIMLVLMQLRRRRTDAHTLGRAPMKRPIILGAAVAAAAFAGWTAVASDDPAPGSAPQDAALVAVTLPDTLSPQAQIGQTASRPSVSPAAGRTPPGATARDLHGRTISTSPPLTATTASSWPWRRACARITGASGRCPPYRG